MKKKVIPVIGMLFLCLVFLFAAPLSAVSVSAANTTAAEMDPLLVDGADLLTDDEEQTLTEKLENISNSQKCAVVIVTTESTDGKSATAYADDYYDYNNYGYGSDKTGILLLLDMGDRAWAISTTGGAITAFTDAGQKYITDEVVSYFSDGEYYDGFSEYADLCDQFLTQATTGEPYDTGNMPDAMSAGLKWLILIIVAAVIGLIVAGIRVSIMKRKLKSVAQAETAGAYTTNGGVRITHKSEIFQRHAVSRVPRPRDTDNGPGGSSTHMGSSGTSHGGSSGHF